MATYRAQSIMKATSGVPEDASVNTWHFTTLDETPAFANITTAWQVFQRAHVGYFPNSVAQTGHELRIYNLADPEPRAPVHSGTWSFASAPTATPMPSEIALCVSFQGARVSGEDQARRRGRIYIGPLGTNANNSGRPASTLPGDLVTEFKNFIDDLNAESCLFIVYSRVDAAAVVVSNVWVDNAFDVQRRRGLVPTSRSQDTFTQIIA